MTPWTINQGTLSISSDTNFGATSSGVTFNGGTLQFLAGFTSNRTVTLNAGGGTLDTNGNIAALAGTIGGSGGLTKIGAGTLTLSAANTYTGGTNISAGMLKLFGPGTLGATTGTTTISGRTLDLGGTAQTQAAVNLAGGTLQNGALNAPISSAGGIINGIGGTASVTTTAGTTTIEGTNACSGATTVNGGTLQVLGSITGTSGVTVNSGGALTGTGIVDPLTTTILSGGTLVPGTAGVPGTSMTIAGNLAFQSGALYVVYLNPTISTFAHVSGTASLAGSVNANFSSGTYLTKQYVVLQSAGINGTFSGLTTANLPAGFTASLAYTSDDVLLNLIGELPAQGLNVNQQNVATALNNFFNFGGALPPNFVSVFGLTNGNLANALTQLDGEAATGAERAVFQLTNEFLNLMLDPFVNGRGNAGVGGSAIGFAPDEEASLPSDIALAYASILKAQPKLPFDQHWTAWGAAYGGSNTANGNAAIGSNNVTASTFGFAGGMDYHFTPDTLAGFALAGAGTNWGLANALSSGHSDAFQAGAYGISWFGPAYIAGALSFSNHWITTNRDALGDQLTANFTGQSYGARLESGYRYAVIPTLGVTPYGALQIPDFNTPAYSESDPRRLRLVIRRHECHRCPHRTWHTLRCADAALWQAVGRVRPGRLGARFCQQSGAERGV